MKSLDDLRILEDEAGRHQTAGLHEVASAAWMKAAHLWRTLADESTGPARRECLAQAEHAWRRVAECSDRVASELGRHPDRIPPGENRRIH